VCLYDGAIGDHVRFYDHEGNYVRTVYPFAARDLDRAQGLKKRAFPPDPRECPLKWSAEQTTLLTIAEGNHGAGWPVGRAAASSADTAASAMALTRPGAAGRPGTIALVRDYVNRLSDGATPGALELSGPKGALTWTYIFWDRPHQRVPGNVAPRSAAFSPDGRWLYLAGYWPYAGHRDLGMLHAVTRAEFAGNTPAEKWLGTIDPEGRGAAHGRATGQFRCPLGVAVDAGGRVYVADHLNDRIQVFDPDGWHLKTIQTRKPVQIFIDPRNGDLYVFSWLVESNMTRKWYAEAQKRRQKLRVPATLTHYGPFENRVRKRTFPLPLHRYRTEYPTYGFNPRGGAFYRAEVDFWAEEPTVWLSQPAGQPGHQGTAILEWWMGNVLIYTLDGGELRLKRDFRRDVAREVAQPRPPYHGRQRLYFDPARNLLLVGEQHYPVRTHSKSFQTLVSLDPQTGSAKVVEMPCSVEDMAFDPQGNLHVRNIKEVVLYDPAHWREIPFDYGEERDKFGYPYRAGGPIASCLTFHGESGPSGQLSGMCVSPRGHIALTVVPSTHSVKESHEPTQDG
jgi:hypothetical protein